MVLVKRILETEMYIRESIPTTNQVGRENIFGKMECFTKDSSKMD
jgi:hypothetical protein